MDSIDLRFDLADVIDLARHAEAAPEHQRSTTDHDDGKPGVASLIWVHSKDTYLKSSGLPIQPDPDGSTGSKRVRPLGWQDPQTWHAISATPIGGDDFTEHFPLLEPEPGCDGQTLLQMLLEAQADQYKYFGLTVTASTDEKRGDVELWFDFA